MLEEEEEVFVRLFERRGDEPNASSVVAVGNGEEIPTAGDGVWGDGHVRVHDHLAFSLPSSGFDVEEFTERSYAGFVQIDAVADLDNEVASLADAIRVVVVREEDLVVVCGRWEGYRVELGVGHFEEVVAVAVSMVVEFR